jgi:exodeoxyribonuclease X
MRAAKHIWPGAPGYSNQVLRYWLKFNPKGVENKFPHQAMYDVATTTELLLKMLEQRPLEQLLQLSSMPARLKTIGFGRYRGTEFSQIPRDYIIWLRNQSNLNEDLVHTLDSILKP